jgi:hypothetical protein
MRLNTELNDALAQWLKRFFDLEYKWMMAIR